MGLVGALDLEVTGHWRCSGRILCPWCFAACCGPCAEADAALLYIPQSRIARAALELMQLEGLGREGGHSRQGWVLPLPVPSTSLRDNPADH